MGARAQVSIGPLFCILVNVILFLGLGPIPCWKTASDEVFLYSLMLPMEISWHQKPNSSWGVPKRTTLQDRALTFLYTTINEELESKASEMIDEQWNLLFTIYISFIILSILFVRYLNISILINIIISNHNSYIIIARRFKISTHHTMLSKGL